MKLNKIFFKKNLSNKRATVTTVNEFGAYPNSLLGNVINKNQKKKKVGHCSYKTLNLRTRVFLLIFKHFFNCIILQCNYMR
jgi:hypothetical protein